MFVYNPKPFFHRALQEKQSLWRGSKSGIACVVRIGRVLEVTWLERGFRSYSQVIHNVAARPARACGRRLEGLEPEGPKRRFYVQPHSWALVAISRHFTAEGANLRIVSCRAGRAAVELPSVDKKCRSIIWWRGLRRLRGRLSGGLWYIRRTCLRPPK